MTATAVASHCPYCALQCATTLTPTLEGPTPVQVTGRDFPTNRGGLCQKGWTAPQVLTAADRLTVPLVRGSLLADSPLSGDGSEGSEGSEGSQNEGGQSHGSNGGGGQDD